MSLPNVFLVGAPKTGTTSLFTWLAGHPAVGAPAVKEPMYYCDLREPFSGPDADYLAEMVVRDAAAYRALYREVAGRPLRLDASTDYLSWPGTAARIAADVPDARVVAILRQPAERAWSEHLHLVRDGLETLSFREALEAEEERTRAGWNTLFRHVARSRYAAGLREYLDVFGPARVRVLLHEELVARRDEARREICAFLGIEPPDTPLPRANPGGRPRSRLVEEMARGRVLPGWMKRAAVGLLGDRVRTLADGVRRANLARRALDPALRRELTRTRFAEDVRETAALLVLDLGHWLP